MHVSVIQANEYRAQERARRDYNRAKKQAQGFVRLCGLEPSFTPCRNPEGNHNQRRVAS